MEQNTCAMPPTTKTSDDVASALRRPQRSAMKLDDTPPAQQPMTNAVTIQPLDQSSYWNTSLKLSIASTPLMMPTS